MTLVLLSQGTHSGYFVIIILLLVLISVSVLIQNHWASLSVSVFHSGGCCPHHHKRSSSSLQCVIRETLAEFVEIMLMYLKLLFYHVKRTVSKKHYRMCSRKQSHSQMKLHRVAQQLVYSLKKKNLFFY